MHDRISSQSPAHMQKSQLCATIYVVIAHPGICTPAQYPFPKFLDISIPGRTFVMYFPVNVYPPKKQGMYICNVQDSVCFGFGETKTSICFMF